jgi:hypothetical protein
MSRMRFEQDIPLHFGAVDWSAVDDNFLLQCILA